MALPFESPNQTFKEKILFVTKLSLTVVVVGLIFFFVIDMLLYLFVAVMVAIFFHTLSKFVADHTPIKRKYALGLWLLLFATVGYFSFKLMAPSVAEQFDQLTSAIPKITQDAKEWLVKYEWGRELLEGNNMQGMDNEKAMGFFNQATGALGGLVHAISMGFVMLFIGLYLAWAPETYRNGFLHLIPLDRRKRIEEVMDLVGYTLKWWLIGRFIDMAFIGILVWLGLTFLGVPLSLILALIAAILNFIPNIGPFLGAIPAIIVAFGAGTETAFYTAILFFIVQSLESAFITPMVQQKVISMPPALTLSAQVLMGATFGTIGLFLATPIAAGLIVAIKQLYVKDVLSDQTVG
jgi:predicted PurR-regulated permease PerM